MLLAAIALTVIHIISSTVHALESELRNNNQTIWSVCDNSSSTCSCGQSISGTVICEASSDTLWIQSCNCIHYDETKNETELGSCIFTCYNVSRFGSMYYPFKRYAEQNFSLANIDACNVLPNLNRRGRFCGQCLPGFGLAVHSYNVIKCIPCQVYGWKNWFQFFAIALLPLTLFYFMVLLFRISFTSSHLIGLVFVLQTLSSPPVQRAMYGALYSSDETDINKIIELVAVKTELAIFGLFNLDFFRGIFPDICLHPDMNILQVLSLDFLIALYPFVLIGLSYTLIHLHDNNNRVIVWAWKPFHVCLKYTQIQNVKTSPAETFATFILLASVKILSVCSDLLVATQAYDSRGKRLKSMFLFYDGTIEYFSTRHIPYAVFALCTCFLLVVMPFLLLLLYPTKCFHKILNWLNLQNHALHIFMDAFQGSYKIQPYDMRQFSAYYLFLRFILLVFVATFKSAFWLMVNAMAIVASAIIVAIFKPYKVDGHNTHDVVLLLLLAIIYMSYAGLVLASMTSTYFLIVSKALVVISALAMLFTNGASLSKWLYRTIHIKKLCAKFLINRNYSTTTLDDFLDNNRRICDIDESSSLIVNSQ